MTMLLVMGVLFVIVMVVLFIAVKRDDKKEKEYHEKYITELVIEDKVFGDVKFEKDSNQNTLTCKCFPKSFGKYNPIIEIQGYDENSQELCFRSLEYIYGMSEEIIETFLEGFLEAYASSKEVTRDRLEQNMDIEGIVLSRCDEYFLEGTSLIKGEALEAPEGNWILCVCSNPNKNKLFKDYYGSFPALYMDCRTRKMCYVLEE